MLCKLAGHQVPMHTGIDPGRTMAARTIGFAPAGTCPDPDSAELNTGPTD